MSDLWQDLAVAVACRLEFERRCDRMGFVDEFTVVRFAAEYLDSQRRGKVKTEEPHPDIPRKFIDLVRETPQGQQLDLGLEAKWLRETGATRSWLKELAVDLFRLQHFRTGTRQGVYRVILVAGTHSLMDEEIFSRAVQTGGGTAPGLDFILPRNGSTTFSRFNLRDGDARSRKWLRSCQSDLSVRLPLSYEARLAGRHQAAEGTEPVEAVVWVTRRLQNWRTFDHDHAWGAA